ncbi:glycosyltransferase [Microbacterium sp. NPDC089189]|uniref:glycosyltransferase n=1 Tax=Microbacterium sp. NPDC089189 TaxID=3154972 RepID=UPI00341A0553
MTVSLRLVLDQLVDASDADVAEASQQIARALISVAPRGCDVAAIVPAGAEEAAHAIDGLAAVTKAPLARPRLAASWQLGIVPGIGGGLIHATSLLAPLVRHDRANDNDQTVVTVWELCAWEVPDDLPRAVVAGQRALMKRVERYADAVVVPSHAMAERLAEISPKLSSRLRVIPGAAPVDFAAPSDAVGRRRELQIPEGAVVIAGARCDDAALAAGLSAVAALEGERSVVVLDIREGGEPRVVDLAEAAGLPASRLHIRGHLDAPDRAAVIDSAVALVAPSALTAFPWRAVDALALGIPVVAVDSAVHKEVLLDGALVAPAEQLGASLGQVLASDESRHRYAVRAGDRGRAFSWRDHAERVWALHAEL